MVATKTLQRFNAMNSPEAVRDLLTLCGSTRWAAAIATGRPYKDGKVMMDAMALAFDQMTAADWLEAFKHHPRIGDISKLRERFAATATQSLAEQKGINGASEATLQALAAGNADYEKRFGHVFLICATGKSADEMLLALRARINNTAEAELANAAAEQRKITTLRFDKWINA